MASLNKVQLIAKIGKQPEIRYTRTGQIEASLSLSTDERFKNRDGEWEKRTEWHRVILLEKLADIAGEYLCEGQTV